MREIKFRAWDNHRKEIYSIRCMKLKVNKDGLFRATNYTRAGKSQKLVLMQYTGLKDKNGVEIYEGDIIEGISSNCFDTGTPSHTEIIWLVDRWHAKGTVFENLQEHMMFNDVKWEVIGNIYENMDLPS